jgi:hypothetical protein
MNQGCDGKSMAQKRAQPEAAPSNSGSPGYDSQFIVGMTNSAPSLMPEGQREVTVLVLV